MSEQIDGAGSFDLAPMGSPVTMRSGAMLRAAREAQGLHIGALAVALKVPVKKLEALEANRFDLLPDTVFVRALSLSVCRVLKIDPAPVMAGLPQLQTPQIKTDESGLNASFRASGSNSTSALFVQLANPIGIGVLVLLFAIVAVLFWPSKPASESSALSKGEIKPISTVASDSPGVSTGIPPDQSQAPDVEPPSSFSEPASSSKLATPEANLPQAILSGALSSTSSGVAGAGNEAPVLGLTARGASWVEVTDAKGISQLRKITSSGEVLQVSGALPLAVVLGRADLVTASVRGQPFDLTAVSKDNVARFEVK
jgi:cytoskeleton protein RodZ